MADRIDVKMIVKAIAQGFDKVTKDVGGVGDAAESSGKKAKKTAGPYEKLAKMFVGVGVAAATAAVAIKKAFEFGEQGANIKQLRQSFEGLMEQWDIAPDYLQNMRNASNNTIDDMSIMAGTMTLVAGASKALGTELLGSSSRLMEIAKAANKLNPTLGDTAFMYDSISKGIKRNSPLILDNLGIVVKVGQANEQYALSIGKTVKELSNEEKQLALLEAVLESGDNLIQQAGGNVEALGDSYAILRTKIKNAGDAFKESFSGPVTAVTDGLVEQLTVIEMVDEAWKKGLLTHEENAAMQKKIQGGYMTEAEYIKLLEKRIEEYNKALEEESQRLAEASDKHELYALKAEASAHATEEAAKASIELIDAKEAEKRALDAVTTAVKGPLGEAMSNYKSQMSDLTDEHADLTGEMENLLSKGYKPNHEKILELTEALEENEQKQLDVADATSQATKEFIFAQAAKGLDAEATLILAREMGLLDDTTYNTIQTVQAMNDQYQRGYMDADEYAKAVALLGDNIGMLEGRTIDVVINIIGRGNLGLLGYIGSGGGGGDLNLRAPLGTGEPHAGGSDADWRDAGGVGNAAGGEGIVPAGYPNDSFLLPVESGEHVSIVSAGNTAGLSDEIKNLRKDLRMFFGAMQTGNQNTIYVNDENTGDKVLEMLRTD